MTISGEFSVYQFFKDGTYERVRRYVSAEEAMQAAAHYTNNVAVHMGVTSRVIITDGGDFTCFEWLADKGVTWSSSSWLMITREVTNPAKRCNTYRKAEPMTTDDDLDLARQAFDNLLEYQDELDRTWRAIEALADVIAAIEELGGRGQSK
jgi:hypothetical protein